MRLVEAAVLRHRRHGHSAPHALLLGVTPEIAACWWPAGTRLLAMDRSHAIIGALWPAPGTPSGACGVCADWRAMPLRAAEFDVVAGDGCYNVFRFPAGADAFGQEVERVLAPGGVFIIRVFLRPDTPETLRDIARDLEGGTIGSIHALKWRIAAAVHGTTQEGVRLADIWMAWRSLLPLAERHGARRGWRPGEFATLDAYRGVDTRYCFPTIADFRCLAAERFETELCPAGGYELAERCRTFVLSRRCA